MGKVKRFLVGILAVIVVVSSDGIVMAANFVTTEIVQENKKDGNADKKYGLKMGEKKEDYALPDTVYQKVLQLSGVKVEERDLEPDASLKSMNQQLEMSLKANVNDMTSADGKYTYYIVNGDEAMITGYKGNDSNIYLPEVIDGYKLVGIGNYAFSGNKNPNLTEISLPDGLTQIGTQSFGGCDSLTTISLPDSLLKIGDSAFYGCVSLTAISLPDSLTQIGSGAFQGTGIKSITIPKNIKRSIYDSNVESAMQGARNLEKIVFKDGITMIPSSVCEHSTVKEIVIPDSVSEIGAGAFEECANLTTISLPDSLTQIGSSAFYGCASLTTISLPDSLTQIGSSAFGGTGIKTIMIPKNVKKSGADYMDSGAMTGAANLERIVFEEGMTKIPNCICKNSFVTEIVIPDSVSEIGEQAFRECANLRELDIPKGVSIIGDNAFAECTELAKVTMHYNDALINTETEGMQLFQVTIGARVFWGCSNLTDVELSENVTSIGAGVFEECVKMESLTLPESLIYLGEGVIGGTKIGSITIPKNVKSCTYGGAMADATSLKKVVFEDGMTKIPDYICANNIYYSDSVSSITEMVVPASVREIGKGAFTNCISLTEVDIQKEVSKIGASAFEGCTGLTKVTMHDNDTWINTESDGAQPFQVTIEGGAFEGCSNLTDVELSKNVTSIGTAAFRECSNLTEIVLNENVTSIGQRAFLKCNNLIKIVLNASAIGWSAFEGCTNLTDVVLEENVTSIENEAFKGCTKLESLILPESLTYLGGNVISGTQISSIVIPQNVRRCGTYALEGAASLKKIIFEDGMKQIPEYIIRPGNSSGSTILEVLIPKSITNMYAFSKCENLVIYGYEDSYAKAYADANNIPFKNASEFDSGNGNSKEFYLSITGNALVGKELMLTGSLTIFDETENNIFDSFINSITLQSSDSDIIDVSDTVCKGVAERLGSKVSISLNFTIVPQKAGTVELTAVTEDGKKATKEIIVEPELIVSSGRSINKKSVLAICFVSLDEPDQDYLEKFMSSLAVKNTTKHYGIDYSTDYRILDNGLSANLIMTIDPSNSFDGLYTFEISTPGEQVKEITINCAVGNYFWSDEDNQITTEDVIMSKAEKEYLAAFDGFIDETHGVIEKNTEKVAESVDNLADFIKKEYGAVIAVPKEMEEKGWDQYVYEALASKIADVANAKMSDISYSTDATTLGANIVKSVFKDYKTIKDSIEYKTKNGQVIVVVIKLQAMYGAFNGEMVCRDAKKPSDSYILGVTMTGEHTDKVLKQYANDLAKLGASATNSIYYAMAEDLFGKSLKDFTADFLKKYAAKYGNKLAEIGLGGLIDFCSTGYDIYKDVKTFSKTLSKANAIEIRDQLTDSKKALDSFWDNANDKNIKRASGKIVKATEKILLLWEEYITTGTVTSYDGIGGFIKSIFSCPVSISVYDADGKEIGYVGDDDIWYDDSISIKEQGDAKIIYTPFDEKVSFKMNGIGYGTLSCAFEEYDKNGNALGRLNYYNISLSPDTQITAALPSENLISEHSDMPIYVDGNAVLADKRISAEEYKDAGISVALQTNNVDGGIVYGAGNYILGNVVNLIALSNEGYIFTGWYDENNMLVSIKRNIEFAAFNNINYTAHFDAVSKNSADDNTKDALVQSILIQQSAVMQNGGKIQFDARVLPENAANKILSWTSDNPSVAVVDSNGLVTAVAAGKATITVSSTDGSNVSSSCVITVTKPYNITPPDENNNTGDNTGGNDSNNGDSGGNNSTGDNPSGDGTTGGSTSGGGSTGGNPSGGDLSGGSSSGNGTDNSNGNPSGDDNKPSGSMQVKLLYYIIEFNANGGIKLSRNTMTLLNDDNLGILPKVQRENCIFNGWYTQKSGGTKVSSSTVLNAGTTLFAQWTKVNKPSKVKPPTLKSQKNRQLAVSFQKIVGAKGYEIAYSTNKKFLSSSTKKIVSASAKKTLKKLKSGKKYYVKVRAYKLDSTGKKIYGTYSKVEGRKVK